MMRWALYEKLPYDADCDFTGVTILATSAEAAMPRFVYEGGYGIVVPALTAKEIVQKLSLESARILKLPDVRECITHEGAIPRGSTPEAFTKRVHDEIATRRKVFQAAGAKPE